MSASSRPPPRPAGSLPRQLWRPLSTGHLTGLTLGRWLRLLRDNRGAVAPSRLPRAVTITVASALNSLLAGLERVRHGRAIERAEVRSPVFIVGVPRSGTTHLHNLLCLDPRFGFPTTFQAQFPSTFLLTESWLAPLASWALAERRSLDDVRHGWDVPAEDELALLLLSLCSSNLTYSFPRSYRRYARFMSMEEATSAEADSVREALGLFLRKLTVRYERPLVLKSPAHTGRIGLLLDVFPSARFVHIHRHPYDVFRSQRAAYALQFESLSLQGPASISPEDWALLRYGELLHGFFRDRGRVPPGSLCEVRYDDLVAEPARQIRRVYETLGLGDFAVVEPLLGPYLASLDGYRRNRHEELPEALRRRIRDECGHLMEALGYEP